MSAMRGREAGEETLGDSGKLSAVGRVAVNVKKVSGILADGDKFRVTEQKIGVKVLSAVSRARNFRVSRGGATSYGTHLIFGSTFLGAEIESGRSQTLLGSELICLGALRTRD